MTNHLPRMIATVTALLALAPGALHAADYRDAPTATLHGALDLGALYMFRDPPNAGPGPGANLVVALTVDAAADPLFGPTYHFEPGALYRFYFTTRADSRPTATIDVTFGPFANGPACPAPAPACQTFKAVFPGNVVVEGLTTQGTDEATHNPPVVTTAGAIRVFAGPRADPIFFDRVGLERVLRSHSFGSMTGVDAYRDKNTSAIVLEFPTTMVFPAATCQTSISPIFSAPCGAWAVTYLRKHDGDDRSEERHDRLDADDFVQLDRFANPLITLLAIPLAQKDAYNAGRPATDAVTWQPVILAQLLAFAQAVGTCPSTATSLAACNPNAPLLTSLLVPDTLKFGYNLPDGYPNGRRPSDRVTDLLLALIAQVPNFSDGTQPKVSCAGFPYLAPPLQLGVGTLNPQSCP
jgi:hypothetical protein